MASSGSPRETWISLPSGARIPISWRADPDRYEAYQARLEDAHGLDPRPHCDCRALGRHLELAVVRRVAEGAARSRYHLARMPNEGRLHHQTCAFHEMDPNTSGAAGYVQGVMDDRADGTTMLRLSRSLRIVQHADAVEDIAPAARSGRTGVATRRAMTPLGLLHVLWEKAGLTLWHPKFAGKRETWRIAHRLQEAAETIVCGRTALHQQLAVIVPGSVRQATRLKDIAAASAGDRYVILIGVVHQASAAEGRIVLRGALPPFNVFLNCRPARIAGLLQQYPFAARLLALDPSARPAQVIGLFIVKTSAGFWKNEPIIRAEVDLAALMETTQEFLPIASGLELQVADRLVAEHRHFSKPLRYDAELDLVFPDFILLDTDQPQGMPMEVFGRSDEAYEQRKAEKTRYYNQHFGNDVWWAWVAAGPAAGPMPSLPCMANQRTSR